MTREVLYEGIDCDQERRRKEFLKREMFKEIVEMFDGS